MEGFEVTKIGKHIFCILDAGNSSFYMVEGDKKAAVIDTGITTGKKITPLLRELTDKPLLLVATHVHCDHIYHMDEFEEVYMCHDEKKIAETTLRTLTAGRLKPWDEIHDIHTDSVISLGNRASYLSGPRTHTGKYSYSGNQGELPVHRRCDRKRMWSLDADSRINGS